MDRDLISSAMEFSPHILKTRRKKKIPASADSKLSLKNRVQQVEPKTPPLSENNNSTRSSTQFTAGSRTRIENNGDKENKHPTLCQCSDCLITSDSSQSPDCTLRHIISPRQCIRDSNIISEDEDTEIVEFDARTTGTHSTYVTCVSKQTKQDDTSLEEDEVEVLQASIRTLVLTPDNSRATDEAVSSCEKVQQWLKNNKTKAITTGDIEIRYISDSEDDSERKHSMAKVSSSGYPNTILSSQRTVDDSFNATSRQSSQDPSTRASSSLFNSSVIVEPIAVQASTSSRSTSMSTQKSVQVVSTQVPITQATRESFISTVTNSQASTRSSSLYFTDRPPWSKHYVDYRNPIARRTLTNIREQNESSINKVSNISTHDSTVSSDDSFHLVYSETISPKRAQSLEISPNNISVSIISNSTRNSYLPTGHILVPRDKILSKRVSSPSLPDTIPASDNSFSIISNTTGNTYHPSRKNQLKEKKSFDSVSIPDTIPIDQFSFSNISTSTRNSHYFRKVSQEKGVPASIPDTVILPNSTDSLSSPDIRVPPPPSSSSQTSADVFSWPLYSKDDLKNILQNIDKQKDFKKKERRNPSSADTIPWPSDCSSPIYPTNSDSEPDSPVHQHARKTLVHTSTRVEVTSEENSSNEENETCVSVSKNISVIEVSDTDEEEIEKSSVDSKGVEIPESSDSEDEHPSKMFRRRPNRASYVEIVISESESEEEEKEQGEERQEVEETEEEEDLNSSSGSEIGRRKTSISPTQEIPESDSSPEIGQMRRLVTRKVTTQSSCRVLESDSSPELIQTQRRVTRTQVQSQDSEETYFSGEEIEIRESRIPPNFDLPEISEDEDGESAARKLDFDKDSSDDESPCPPSRSNRSSDKSPCPPRKSKTSNDKSLCPPRRSKKSNKGGEQRSSITDTGKKLRPVKLSISPFKSPELPSARKTHNISSDSSDNDDKLDKFFQSERAKREKKKLHESLDDSPNFIVDDEHDSGDDFCNSKVTPSFYLRILNEDLRRRADKKYVAGQFTPQPKQDLHTPTPTKGREAPKTVGRAQPKPTYLGGKNAQFSPVLSFVASLSGPAASHPRCHPEARQFTKNFNRNKKVLTARLYALFNETVFSNKLQADMSITWNNRLRTTAGFCYNQRKPIGMNGDCIRSSRIELSSKILHEAGRLRDTLIHEMCHAATWVISGEAGGHGRIWKQWTEKARRCFPELPEISRCHSYEVKTNYTYRCTDCGYSIGRHSNSLDIARKVCGLCRGRFEIVDNRPGRATGNKTPNVFALFVKEHYSVVKNNRKSLKHGDVMKLLSQRFAEHKISQK